MVANSSADGTLNSLRNGSTKGSHEIKKPLIFQGFFYLVKSGGGYKFGYFDNCSASRASRGNWTTMK